jgi:hypothetical protein
VLNERQWLGMQASADCGLQLLPASTCCRTSMPLS